MTHRKIEQRLQDLERAGVRRRLGTPPPDADPLLLAAHEFIRLGTVADPLDALDRAAQTQRFHLTAAWFDDGGEASDPVLIERLVAIDERHDGLHRMMAGV